MTVSDSSARPIFIHAMWRTGSTYVWNKFREMDGYRAYYEPLHEDLARLRREEFEGVAIQTTNQDLHHPLLQKHYFHELPSDAEGWVPLYRKEFAHDLYCLAPEEGQPELFGYIQSLLDYACEHGEVPVLQFNRSLFRSGWLSLRFSPVNLLLIRDPYDTWRSLALNEYFYGGVCRIVGQHRSRPCLHAIAERWKVPYVDATYEEREEAYRAFYRERGERLYAMFYAVMVVSILENLPHTDVVLDINALSESDEVRAAVQTRLRFQQIDISFADCSIQRYSEDEASASGRRDEEQTVLRYLRTTYHPRRNELRAAWLRHAAMVSPCWNETLDRVLGG